MVTGSHATSLHRSLRRVGRMLYRHALADSTNIKYQAHWKQWFEFNKIMRWSPWLSSNKSSSRHLRYFAVYLWQYGWNCTWCGNMYTTIQKKIASVLWFHRRFQGINIDRSAATSSPLHQAPFRSNHKEATHYTRFPPPASTHTQLARSSPAPFMGLRPPGLLLSASQIGVSAHRPATHVLLP